MLVRDRDGGEGLDRDLRDWGRALAQGWGGFGAMLAGFVEGRRGRGRRRGREMMGLGTIESFRRLARRIPLLARYWDFETETV